MSDNHVTFHIGIYIINNFDHMFYFFMSLQHIFYKFKYMLFKCRMDIQKTFADVI